MINMASSAPWLPGSMQRLTLTMDVFQEEGKFPAAIDLMAKVGYASVHCQPAHACKCYVGWFGICFGKLSSVAHAGMRLCWLTII